MLYLGIDFGTSFTKAAVYNTTDNNYTAIKLGKNTSIPTVAFFVDGNDDPYIGDEAINYKKMPNGLFFNNFKPELDTLSDESSDRRIKISSIIVKYFVYIKGCAQEQIKQTFNIEQDFNEVVITVPASSPKDGTRYQIMKNAAKEAGFKDILIVSEPVAAAYYLLGDRVHSEELDDSLFLIYDFGGGTFDTSIIKISDQQIQVIDESIGSDNEQKWGGIYIDSRIGMDYIKRSDYAKKLVSLIKDNSQPVDIRINASENITSVPTKAKEYLSQYDEYTNDFGYTLLREDFEGLIQDMVDNTIQCTQSLIDSASKEKLCEGISSVKKVFLVGGTSQIPLVYKRWLHHKNSVNNDASYELEVKKELDIVALGASRYRDLKLSPSQLNEKGIEKAKNGEYMKAAAFFNNAADKEGQYWLGVLYYLGAIGRKRQPAKAYKYFTKAFLLDDANLMMALMRFDGDGVLKDDSKAKKLLKKLPDSTLKTALESVIENNYDENHLRTIYDFNAATLFSKGSPNPIKESSFLDGVIKEIKKSNTLKLGLGLLAAAMIANNMANKKNDEK